MSDRAETKFTTHIDAENKGLGLHLSEVWKYRELIFLFTRRHFVLRYKQTILGPVWALIQPVLSSVILTIVFGKIVEVDTNGVPHILFYLCSNAVWGFFSGCVDTNANTFVSNAYLFGKVYFPRLTVPLASMLSGLLNLCIQLLIAVGFAVYFAVRGMVTPRYAALPLLVLPLLQLGLLGVGTGVLLSSMTTKYRDLGMVVPFALHLWMYVSPVVYPLSQLQEGTLHTLILLNPVTAPMEQFRAIALGVGGVPFWSAALSLGLTLVLAFVGVTMFSRVERTFMDTI